MDKNKLLGVVGVKKPMFDKLCQEMYKIIQELVAGKKFIHMGPKFQAAIFSAGHL